jgi:hypothetical protein
MEFGWSMPELDVIHVQVASPFLDHVIVAFRVLVKSRNIL